MKHFFRGEFQPSEETTCVYPELNVRPGLDRDVWFSSYIATYLERDVRNIKLSKTPDRAMANGLKRVRHDMGFTHGSFFRRPSHS